MFHQQKRERKIQFKIVETIFSSPKRGSAPAQLLWFVVFEFDHVTQLKARLLYGTHFTEYQAVESRYGIIVQTKLMQAQTMPPPPQTQNTVKNHMEVRGNASQRNIFV